MPRAFAVFFSAAMIVVGLVHIVVSSQTMLVALRSRAWPAVAGRIVKSEVVVNKSGRINYTPEITYIYRGADQEVRTGTQVWPKNYSLGAAFSTEVVGAYRVGADVNVYDDPTDPNIAFLRPGPNLFLLSWCVISWAVAGIGLLVLRYTWRSRRAYSGA